MVVITSIDTKLEDTMVAFWCKKPSNPTVRKIDRILARIGMATKRISRKNRNNISITSPRIAELNINKSRSAYLTISLAIEGTPPRCSIA